jgi:hypothetical protein
MTPTLCKLLRGKSPSGDAVGDPAASHWCLATMECFGPDEQPVHGLDCQAGRPCFQRPPDGGELLAEAGPAAPPPEGPG